MKNRSFDSYLGDICFGSGQNISANDMPDVFEKWLTGLRPEELIIYANGWMNETKSNIRTEMLKLTKTMY